MFHFLLEVEVNVTRTGTDHLHQATNKPKKKHQKIHIDEYGADNTYRGGYIIYIFLYRVRFTRAANDTDDD